MLYLLRLLLSVVTKFPFDVQSSGLVIVYLHALDMLYIQSLEEFPYHIPGGENLVIYNLKILFKLCCLSISVVSNDELYGHDHKYLAEVNNICVQVISDILAQLKILGSKHQLRTQATLALELFLRIVRYANLSREKTFQLAVNLWLLSANAESHIDVKLIVNYHAWMNFEHSTHTYHTYINILIIMY